ncbi:unnamed protein product [Fusarium langsethiae]|nr:unnamed protein product [Fusarium langsethiae]
MSSAPTQQTLADLGRFVSTRHLGNQNGLNLIYELNGHDVETFNVKFKPSLEAIQNTLQALKKKTYEDWINSRNITEEDGRATFHLARNAEVEIASVELLGELFGRASASINSIYHLQMSGDSLARVQSSHCNIPPPPSYVKQVCLFVE